MNNPILSTTISTNISTNGNGEKDIFIKKLYDQCQILLNENNRLKEKIEWQEDELKEIRGYTLYLNFENGNSGEYRYHSWEYKNMKSKLNYHYHDPFYHGAVKVKSYEILENGKLISKG
tara:strand:- start:493 stop:849 length:357 start_codon:yes stop_codon:yes gene_type:complete